MLIWLLSGGALLLVSAPADTGHIPQIYSSEHKHLYRL